MRDAIDPNRADAIVITLVMEKKRASRSGGERELLWGIFLDLIHDAKTEVLFYLLAENDYDDIIKPVERRLVERGIRGDAITDALEGLAPLPQLY